MKAPEICNSNKKRLQSRCFPENFAKFLRITFLQNSSRQLFLDFFIHLTNRNQVFYIFEHVLSHLSKVMNIMTLAFGKLYFAKQTIHKSSLLHMLFKVCVLKNFTNFTCVGAAF